MFRPIINKLSKALWSSFYKLFTILLTQQQLEKKTFLKSGLVRKRRQSYRFKKKNEGCPMTF